MEMLFLKWSDSLTSQAIIDICYHNKNKNIL